MWDARSLYTPCSSITVPEAAMAGNRRMHPSAFMRPDAIHTAWWRCPGSYPNANFNLQHLMSFAQMLERG